MEGILTHEISPTPYEKIATTFASQLRLFESRKENEVFEGPADAIFAFAEFIRNESEKVLEGVQEQNDYHLEKAAAKLHEFNLANAAVLHRYAELLGKYPDSVEPLVATFPWLKEVSIWAEAHTQRV